MADGSFSPHVVWYSCMLIFFPILTDKWGFAITFRKWNMSEYVSFPGAWPSNLSVLPLFLVGDPVL